MSETESGLALAELKRARKAARRAVDTIQARKSRAFDERNFDEFERLAAILPRALDAEHLATQRLIAGIINPTGENVVSLKDATKELNERIAKFKEEAAGLSGVANALSIITNAILLFGLL